MSTLFPELDAYERLDIDPGLEPELSATTRTLLDQLAQGVAEDADAGESGEVTTADSEEDEASGVYREHASRLSRPGIAAGVESRARFEKAFGLVGKIRTVKKTESGCLEFVAEVDERGTLGCGIIAPLGEKAWREGKSFTLSYLGELHPVIAKALMRFMARYDGAPLPLILDQVVPDPGDEHMIANDYPESVFYAYAPASGWRRFFEGTELYRGACGSNTGDVAIIDHSDLECVFSQPSYDERLPSFLNVPGVERAPEPDRPSEQPRPGGPRMLYTDIGDIDVIKGADILVDQALEVLAALPEHQRPERVIIQSGCLPEVTGDDTDASAARTQSKLRLPVLSVGHYNDIPGFSLGERIDRDPELTPARALEPSAVVLLGMPAFVGRSSLLALLRRAGVDVGTPVFPEIPQTALEQLRRASVLVAYPWERYDTTIASLAERLAPARLLQPRAPFGMANSRRWLLNVGAAVDRRAQVEAELEVELATLRPRWEMLRARARHLRVGFVVDHGNWRSALSTQQSLGVPMLEMLVEMGFGVDVLAYAGDRSAGAEVPGEERFDSIRVRRYRSVDELDRYLADPRVAAWYSELHYDRRLTRNGKNAFSMRQFKMGLTGALSSLEAMLDLTNMSFYRSYGRYLGAAFLERDSGSQP